MSLLAPTLEKYFTLHLGQALRASNHTIAAYRDTWRLLLAFINRSTGTEPANVDISILDSALINRFTRYLREERGNSTSTSNARLAAIRSFFAYAAYQHPEHADLIGRVLATPARRSDRADICYLTDPEITAILAAPDRSTVTGRRDHALILTAISTGMRVSELTGATWADIHLGTGASLLCHGKGRKDRATPLSREDTSTLTVWKTEQHPVSSDYVFPARTGTRMSTDAVAQRLTVHTHSARAAAPSLTTKNITPHVLRHTAAMRMLHAGIGIEVIALWLGHESSETTQIYLHADLTLKEAALDRIRPTGTPAGRFTPDDALMTFLEAL